MSSSKPKIKRFSISLDEDDYLRLKKIADEHSPRVSLQYVTQLAILRFLNEIEDPQLDITFDKITNRKHENE